MRLTSPLLPTRTDPSLSDMGVALDELTAVGQRDPVAPDRFLILDADDGTGAFIQAIAVDGHPHWHVEVTNSSEAALRGLKDPVSRGRACEYLARFLNGERSLGNGEEWIDVDSAASRQTVTPAALASMIIVLLIAAVATYFVMRHR